MFAVLFVPFARLSRQYSASILRQAALRPSARHGGVSQVSVLFLKRHGAGEGTADTAEAAATAVRLKQEGSEAFAVVVVFLMSTHQHCWVAFEALKAAASREEEEALEAFVALSEVASSWRTPPPGAARSTRRCCRRRPPRVACLGSEAAADDEALLVFTGAAGGAM